MAVETETQLEAFIAANSGGTLKKIELSDLTFNELTNYFNVYGEKFKSRTAFIDNVFVTFNNITMQVLFMYDDEHDEFEFEYSSMDRGTLDNLVYINATGSGNSMSYSVAYMNGAFLDAETRALMNLGSRISCDIYVLE